MIFVGIKNDIISFLLFYTLFMKMQFFLGGGVALTLAQCYDIPKLREYKLFKTEHLILTTN